MSACQPQWFNSPYAPMMGVTAPPPVPGWNYSAIPAQNTVPSQAVGGVVGPSFPPPPPGLPQSSLVPEHRRLMSPSGTSSVNSAAVEVEESKESPNRVRAFSARSPKLYIVKCNSKLGYQTQSMLMDTCAPCCLMDAQLVFDLKGRGLARNTSYREYPSDISLVGITGQKLLTYDEMEVDFQLEGHTVTRNFIPVRNFADKMLLAADFMDDYNAKVDFETRSVHVKKLGVSLPMTGFWRRVKGRLPRVVVFVANEVTIPPLHQQAVKVMHLGSDPLSYVTREAYVRGRSDAVRPSQIRVVEGLVRFDRGAGTIVVVNHGDKPITLQAETAIAEVLPSEGREKPQQLGNGKSLGVFRVRFEEEEEDLSSDKVPVVASLAIKAKGELNPF